MDRDAALLDKSTSNCVSNLPPGIDVVGPSVSAVRAILQVEVGRLREVPATVTGRLRRPSHGKGYSIERDAALSRPSIDGALTSAAVVVHVKWWGDLDHDGHFIRPSSRNQADRKLRYAVRCSNRQLEAYLGDILIHIQTLPLKIYASRQPDGRKLLGVAYVDSLDLLPLRKAIAGTYPVMSPGGEMLATLDVSIRLIDLTADDRPSRSKSSPSKLNKSLTIEPALMATAKARKHSSILPFSPRLSPRTASTAGLRPVSLLPSDDGVQRTLSSLIERGRRLRHDITKLLLEEEEDGDEVQFLSRRNVQDEHLKQHCSSVSEVVQSLLETDISGVVHRRDNNLVRNVEAALNAAASSSSSSDTDYASSDEPLVLLKEGVSMTDEAFGNVVKEGRLLKSNEVPTKQVSFHKEVAAKRLPVLLAGNKDAQKKVTNKKVPALLRNVVPGIKKLHAEADGNINVFCALLIYEGKLSLNTGTRTRTPARLRLYLSCRTFWSDNVAKSGPCSPSSNDTFLFDFRHEAVTAFSEFVLERRIRNNVMVVEVWLEDANQACDRLLGTCKLPLKLIYEAFGEGSTDRSAVANAVVVAVDDVLPVCELLTGREVGKLGVRLAIGTDRKRVLQRLDVVAPSSTQSFLKGTTTSASADKISATQSDRHVFEVTVKSVMLTRPPAGNQVWGESNCRVDYRFFGHPTTLSAAQGAGDSSMSRSFVSDPSTILNWILCEPVMHWNSTLEHVVDLVGPVSVLTRQSEECIQPGLEFRVSCMHYYPVELIQIVSQVIVRPSELRKLVAKSGVSKTFNLPLHALDNDDSSKEYASTIGILTVHLCHRYCGGVPVSRPSRMTSRSSDDLASRNHKATNTSMIYPHDFGAVDTVPTKELSRNKPAEIEALVNATFTTNTELGTEDQSCLAVVVVERATHLGYISQQPPNSYVTLETLSEKLRTDVVPHDDAPNWNCRFDSVRCGESSTSLVFSVHHHAARMSDDDHSRDSDQLIGRASVDLSPLNYGLPLLCGWYNIVDGEARCKGQLKVLVQPTWSFVSANDVQVARTAHSCDAEEHDLSSTGRRFVTSGSYDSFPSHIGQFVEQRICWEPPTTEDIEAASRSFLVDNLRRRLEELDDLLVGGCPKEPKALSPKDPPEQLAPVEVNSLTNGGPAQGQQQHQSEAVASRPPKMKTKRRCRLAAAIYKDVKVDP